MNRLSGPRGWLCLALRTAVLCSLALIANPLRAADAVQPPTRSSTSRYAARQVRVPAEPAPTKTAVAPAAKRKVTSTGHAVRAATHIETSPAVRGSSRVQRSPSGYRTANRVRNMMPQEHSVIVQEGEIMEGSAMMPEQIPAPAGEVFMEDGEIMSHPGMVDDGCQGGACQGGNCGTCCLIPCPDLSFDNFEFFAGADAFSGPLNRGQGGSFGFHEGVNWGQSLPCSQILSAQAGFQAIQSTFSGNDITDQDRRQFFGTAGLFRRVDWGLQGGLVVDYLHDEWYYQALDLAQVRGEISWVFPCNHELGFWFAQGINNSMGDSEIQTGAATSVTLAEGWHSTDLYAFFYRHQFEGCNAYGRVFGGFTGESDGLVGADFNVPLTESLALRSDFTYLIPSEGHSQLGNEEESWNVSLGLVWYPGCRTARSKDYNRPLFNVANNGTFMVDRD